MATAMVQACVGGTEDFSHAPGSDQGVNSVVPKLSTSSEGGPD